MFDKTQRTGHRKVISLDTLNSQTVTENIFQLKGHGLVEHVQPKLCGTWLTDKRFSRHWSSTFHFPFRELFFCIYSLSSTHLDEKEGSILLSTFKAGASPPAYLSFSYLCFINTGTKITAVLVCRAAGRHRACSRFLESRINLGLQILSQRFVSFWKYHLQDSFNMWSDSLQQRYGGGGGCSQHISGCRPVSGTRSSLSTNHCVANNAVRWLCRPWRCIF